MTDYAHDTVVPYKDSGLGKKQQVAGMFDDIAFRYYFMNRWRWRQWHPARLAPAMLLNLLPFEEFRAEKLLQSAHDAQDHFASGGDRLVQTFWFGYDICHALIVFRGECVIVILHTRAEEADFLRRAAQTCLEDSQLLIDALLNPSPVDGGETQLLTEDELHAAADSKPINLISRLI